MEMEASPSPSPNPSPKQVVARKLWNIVRIVFLMLRKGISKSKLAADFNLNLLLKRGKLAATKAIANTILHRSQNNDVVYPRDYEFSCSNSPALFHVIKRSTNRHHHHHHRCTTTTTKFPHYDDVSTVQKVLEILNNNKVEASPLPGFGKSPIGRKLVRITDSPFPLKDEEGGDDNQVDVAAEEFIKRFYKDLNLQQKMAAIDSPYHSNLWDR